MTGGTTCPVCESRPIEIRGKLVCPFCHIILETCCEGGRCEYAKPAPEARNTDKDN